MAVLTPETWQVFVKLPHGPKGSMEQVIELLSQSCILIAESTTLLKRLLEIEYQGKLCSRSFIDSANLQQHRIQVAHAKKDPSLRDYSLCFSLLQTNPP